MKRYFLVGVLVSISMLSVVGQSIRTAIQPSVVNGKFRLAFVLQNNTNLALAPANSRFEATVDTNFIDISSMLLVSPNSKWHANANYNPMQLVRLFPPDEYVFSLSIIPDPSLLGIIAPPASALMAVGQIDTVAYAEFDIKDPCISANVRYRWIAAQVNRWNLGGPIPMVTQLDPSGVESFNYIKNIPTPILSASQTTLCDATPVDLSISGFGSSAPSYSFDFMHYRSALNSYISLQNAVGDTTLGGVNVLNSGDSMYVVATETATSCEFISNVIPFSGASIPSDFLPSDTSICLANPLNLQAPIGVNYNYAWSTTGNGVVSPTFVSQAVAYQANALDIVSSPIKISVRVDSAGLCTVRDSVELTVVNTIVIADTAVGYAVGDTAFMSWNPVLGATNYQVAFYLTNNPPGTVTYVSIGSDTSFSFLGNGTGIEDWTFQFVATGSCGNATSSSRIVLGDCVNLPITSIADSAYITSVSASSIGFAWAAVQDASFYDVNVSVNGSLGTWVSIGNVTNYTVGGLSTGDNVCLTYRARTSCDEATALVSCVVAFDCSAGFTGLRDVAQTYCTSSFKDLIEPDSANNFVGSYYFTGNGVMYGAGLWYFDPQDAGAGTHTVTMIGCYGTDTVSRQVTVLPAPCSEPIDTLTFNIKFKSPQGIFTDCLGQVYFSSAQNENLIVKVDSFGVGSIIAGIPATVRGMRDGHISQALLASPISITMDVDDSLLYFVDSDNHALRYVDLKTDSVFTIAGGGDALISVITGLGDLGDSDNPVDYANNRMFNFPFGLTFGANYDTIYVSDQANRKVKALALNKSGSRVTFDTIFTVAGYTIINHIPTIIANSTTPGPALSRSFFQPAHLAYDNGRIFVGEEGGNALQNIHQVKYIDLASDSLKFLTGLTPGYVDGSLGAATFYTPIGVASNGQGDLFVVEKGNCSIRKISPSSVTSVIGDPDLFPGGSCGIDLNSPTGLSVFVNGFIDIVNTGDNTIKRFAVDDFLNSPNKELDSVYCLFDAIDTINVNSVAGFYTSSPTGFVVNNGTHWVFNPSVDTGFVTISFNHQVGPCQGAERRTVYVAPLPVFDLGNDTLICATSFGVDSLMGDASLGALQWSFKALGSSVVSANLADSNFYKIIDASGTYYLTITSPYGCTYEDSIQIMQRTPIGLSITSSNGNNLCYGDSSVLTVANSVASDPLLVSFAWNTGDTTASAIAKKSGDYIVDVVDSLGCISADTFRFTVQNRPYTIIDVDTTYKNNQNGAYYNEWEVGTLATGLFRPWDVVYKDNEIFFTENRLIRVVDLADTTVLTLAGGGAVFGDSLPALSAALSGLKGLAWSEQTQGWYFIEGNQIKLFKNDTIYQFAGSSLSGNEDGVGVAAQFDDPKGIVVDAFGNAFVADFNSHNIKRINPSANVSFFAGDTSVLPNNALDNGQGADARFNWPWGLVITPNGQLFVSNDGGHVISQVDLDANSQSLVGAGGISGSSGVAAFVNPTPNQEIAAADARLFRPWNMVSDEMGNIYFTDAGNSAVRMLTSQDSVITLAGTNTVGTTDGLSNAARFSQPTGITRGEDGRLYVADFLSGRIRTLTQNKAITVCREEPVTLNAAASSADNYQWFLNGNAIASSPSIVALDSGTYVVRVELGGCVNFDSIRVNYFATPTINIDTTRRVSGGSSALTICPGDSIQLQGNPINLSYSYRWTDLSANVLSTDTAFLAKAADTYVLTITTENACLLVDTVTINHFAGLVSIVDDTICIRSAHTFDAGAGFVSYLWSDNSIGQTLVVADSGTYSVEVVSADGCTFNDSAYLTVLVPDSIDVQPDSAVTICALDSTLLTTVQLGSSAGTVSWSDGGVGTTNYVNTAGYQVAVFTDAVTSCTSLDSVLIQVIARPVIDTLTTDSTICKRDTLPLYVRSTLATDSAFIYAFNTTTLTRTLVAADVYETTFNGVDTSDIGTYIYVLDNGYCFTEQTSVINATDLATTIMSPTDTICYGDAILFTQQTTGGRTPYTYTWAEYGTSLGTISDTTQASVTAVPNNPGAINYYRLRVEDAVNCFAYDTVGVYLITPIVTTIGLVSGGDIDTVAVCSNGTTPVSTPIFMTVNGGIINSSGTTPAQQYQNITWYVKPADAATIGFNGFNTATPIIQSRSPIPDTVTVYVDITDQFGCTITDSVVFKLRAIEIALEIQHMTVCPGLKDSVIVSVISGGSGNYTYNWFEASLGGGGLPTIDNPFSDTIVITPTYSMEYTVDVYDVVLGCPAPTVGFDLTVVPITANLINSGIVCDGDTAILSAVGSSGAVQYSNTSLWPWTHRYEWSKIDNAEPSYFVSNDDFSETVNILGGTPGDTTQYQLIVSDSIGCKDTLLTDVIWNRSIIAAIAQDTFYVCNDDLTQLFADTATGGVSNSDFQYNWQRLSGSVNFPFGGGLIATNIQHPNVFFNPSNPSDTSEVILTVFDTIGCFVRDVAIVINNNLDFRLIPTYDTACADVPNRLMVEFIRDTNDFNGYVYNWYDPADAPELFVDSLGTTPSTSIRSPYVITNDSQVYELEITDLLSGCTAIDSTVIFVYDIQPIIGGAPWPDDTTVACFGEVVNLTSINSNGGTVFDSPALPYIYDWSRSASGSDASVATTATNQPSATIASNGSNGQYSIWVLELTDKAGCSRKDSTTIYWNTDIVPVLREDTVYVCNSETPTLEVDTLLSSGGISPYTYTWTKVTTATGGAANLLETTGSVVRVSSVDNDTTVFRVTLTDTAGCVGFRNVTVIGVIYSINATATSYQICAGINDTLGVQFTGDIAGAFQYVWSPNIEINDTTLREPIVNLSDDRTYTVTVYDSTFKCSATDNVSIDVIELVAVAGSRVGLDTASYLCAEELGTTLSGSGSFGGTPPYVYSWSTFGSSELSVFGSLTNDSLTVLKAAVSPIDTTLIGLTVRDQFGCVDTDSVAIYWNSEIQVNIDRDVLYICDEVSKTVGVNSVVGGTGAYSYSWTSSDAVQLLSATNATSVDVSTFDNDISKVFVTVTDSLGCQNSDSISIEGVNFGVNVSAMALQICPGIEDTLYASMFGDLAGAYRYTWSPAIEINTTSGTPVIVSPTSDRTYTVSVYDSTFECIVSNAIDIDVVDLVAVAGSVKGLDTLTTCFENDVVNTDASNSTFGGLPLTGGYTYAWSVPSGSEVTVVGTADASSFTVAKAGVTPIDTTVLKLVIEDLYGCSDSDYVAVYWNSAIQASILDDSLYICSNTPNVLEAVSALGGTGTYSYGWSVISGSAQLASDTTTQVISVNTGNNDVSFIRLKVTDALGCYSFDTARVEGLNFQVTAAAQYTDICAGLSDTLRVTNFIDGIGGYTYLWTPNSAIDNTTSPNPVVNPLVPTVYTVTVTDSTTGCSSQSSVSIDIYEFMAVAGPTAALDTLLRCFEATNDIQLSASLTNGGTLPYSYSWSTTDPTVNMISANANPGIINRAVPGDGSISTLVLLVTDNIGCTSTDSVKVLWNSEIVTSVTPDVLLAGIIRTVAVCVGEPKVVTNLNISGGSGDYTFSWGAMTGAGINIIPGTQTAQTPSVRGDFVGAQRTLTVSILDHPISNATCPKSENLFVVAYDVAVELEVDEDTVCPNTLINLTATPSDNIGTVFYSWDNETSYVLSNTSTIQVDTVSFTSYVYVRDDSTGCTNFDSVDVSVIPVSADLQLLTPGQMCYGDSLLMARGLASGGKPGAYSYEWYLLPDLISSISSNDTLITYPPVTPLNILTTYKLKVFDLLGCADSIQIGVRRNDSIVVDAGLDRIICVNENTQVGGSPTAGYQTIAGGFEYNWTGGAFDNSTLENPIFIPTTAGMYDLSVEVKSQGLDCFAYDTLTVDVRPLPLADFGDLDAFVCADSSKILYAYGVDTNYVYPPRTTFEWRKIQLPVNVLLGSDSSKAIITTGGTYQVIVQDSIGCINSDLIDLNDIASPLIWARPLDSLECSNRSLILIVDSLQPARGLEADTVMWTVLYGDGFVDEPMLENTMYIPMITDDSVAIKVDYINVCGIGSDTVYSNIAAAPIAVLNVSDSTINLTESAMFDAFQSESFTGNALSYTWFFNAPNVPNLAGVGEHEVHYNNEGRFMAELFVQDVQTGCYDSASVTISVNGTYLLFVPNVFSPRANNIENQTLKMYGFGVSDANFIFTVYNRWGEKVYEQTSFTDAISIGWNGDYRNSGEPLDMGVYTYIVRATYVDGTPVEKVGTITLLR